MGNTGKCKFIQKCISNFNIGVFSYFQNDIIVEDVISDLEGLQFSIKNGEVRIVWAGKGGTTNIAANEEFIFLKVKTKDGIKINDAIHFNIDKISEFSDANGEKIYGITMFLTNLSTTHFNSLLSVMFHITQL